MFKEKASVESSTWSRKRKIKQEKKRERKEKRERKTFGFTYFCKRFSSERKEKNLLKNNKSFDYFLPNLMQTVFRGETGNSFCVDKKC